MGAEVLDELSQVRVVFFDADETIFHLRQSVGTFYSEAAQDFGLSIPAQALDQEVGPLWQEFEALFLNKENAYQSSIEREQELWNLFSRRLYQRVIEDVEEELIQHVYEIFADPKTRVPAPGISNLLSLLRSQGIKTGVLSNNDQRIFRLVDGLGLAPLFDYIFPSSFLGYKKPSSRCFEEAAQRCACPGKRILYVGDNFLHDYQAAQLSGWQALWFNPRQQEPPAANVRSVTSHHEIIELFC